MKDSVGARGDSGKNRMSGSGGISLRIRLGHFCRRVNQQISCPAIAGRGKRWSSGSSSSPSTRSGRFLAACLAMTFTPSASRRSAMPPSACCAAPPLRSARSATGLAAARGLNSKHATKQVDRLLSNPNINVDDILARWVPYIVGARSCIVVALDWTDFDADNQATIMLSLITDHGRATPLVWLTVEKDTLKDHRSRYEHRVLVRLAELLPADIKVCVVADRGFGDQKLYRMLTEELCFDYVIRFRGNIAVTATTGETRTAAAWVRPGGRARVLRRAAVPADRYAVGTVVCVQDA